MPCAIRSGTPPPLLLKARMHLGAVIAALFLGSVIADDACEGTLRYRRTPVSPYFRKQMNEKFDTAEYGQRMLELHEVISAQNMQDLGRKHVKAFRQARPFPHITLDNIFPDAFLRKFIEEFPELTKEKASRLGGGISNRCRSTAETWKCSLENDPTKVMSTPYSRVLYSLLQSQDFVNFLEKLTGITGIISDNAMMGSGFDQTLPGGSLPIHTDFHFHKRLRLTRRVNVFLYLNEDWEEHFGGHLELWNQSGSVTQRPAPGVMKHRILPVWNRMFIFTTGDHTFHGHPMPLNTTTRTRRSVAMYYFTNGNPKTEPHEGKEIEMEQPDPATNYCSGVPFNRPKTFFPSCEDFISAATYRDGQKCPKHELGRGRHTRVRDSAIKP